jgi:hypothetical protein
MTTLYSHVGVFPLTYINPFVIFKLEGRNEEGSCSFALRYCHCSMRMFHAPKYVLRADIFMTIMECMIERKCQQSETESS